MTPMNLIGTDTRTEKNVLQKIKGKNERYFDWIL